MRRRRHSRRRLASDCMVPHVCGLQVIHGRLPLARGVRVAALVVTEEVEAVRHRRKEPEYRTSRPPPCAECRRRVNPELMQVLVEDKTWIFCGRPCERSWVTRRGRREIRSSASPKSSPIDGSPPASVHSPGPSGRQTRTLLSAASTRAFAKMTWARSLMVSGEGRVIRKHQPSTRAMSATRGSRVAD